MSVLPSSFNGQVIWVIGASSGIGEGLAIAFAREGAKLILSARRVDALAGVRERCIQVGRAMGLKEEDVRVLPLDLSAFSSHEADVESAIGLFGHIDRVVHSGGITSRSIGMETGLEVDRRVMDVNHFGVLSVTKLVLPHMVGRGMGHVVVITSVVGKIGTQLRSAYAASKHALHGWFDSVRLELDGSGVDVTLVCPGFIATELTMNALTADGSALGEMNEAQVNGMPTHVFARKLLPKLAAGRHEVYIGGKEILAIYLKRFVPGLLHQIVKRSKVT